MSSSPHHWFVQTDFGALLGPMPDDALAELARTGALLIRDRVREGTDGEWRSAGDVPGLFDEQTPSLGLLSSTLEDLFAPEKPAPRRSRASRTANRRAPPKIADAPVANKSPTLGFEIAAPLIAPPAATKPPPVVSAPRPVVDTHVIAPQAEPLPVNDPAIVEPPPTPQPLPNWEAPVTAAPRWHPPSPAARLKTPRGKSAWITVSIAVAVLLMIVAAWWFWPRQRADIYASYVAIYKELQERRAETSDQTGWTEFVSRSQTQLDATVPWLEKRATPGDREKSLLLYAGRDLQELLELPQGTVSPHQKRLNAFFEQLREMYGSK
jgi:hypothetical protein